jgi:hypothetical protein
MGRSVEISVPEFVRSLAEIEEPEFEGSTDEQHAMVYAKTFEK